MFKVLILLVKGLVGKGNHEGLIIGDTRMDTFCEGERVVASKDISLITLDHYQIALYPIHERLKALRCETILTCLVDSL
jgi:hypothetical protein